MVCIQGDGLYSGRGLYFGDDHFSAFLHHHEPNFVARFDGIEQRLVFHQKHHGHGWHGQMNNGFVLDGELGVVFVDFSNFTLCQRSWCVLRWGWRIGGLGPSHGRHHKKVGEQKQ